MNCQVCNYFTFSVIKLCLLQKTYKDVWCVLHPIDIERKINPRIELYDDESKVGTSSRRRVVYICEAVWNTNNTLEFSFSFLISKYRYVFITTSNESVRLWILHLCCVSKELYDKKHLVGIDDQGKLDPDALFDRGTDGTVVLNTLYASSADSSSKLIINSIVQFKTNFH